MNNFNSVVLGALDIAQTKALELKNTELSSAHLLFGLIRNKSTFSSKSLKEVLPRVEEILQNRPSTSSDIDITKIRPDGSFSNWVTMAGANAAKESRGEITEKDLVKFLPQIFPNLEIDYSKLAINEEESEIPSFLVNLNDKAKEGKLDPVIGRTKEIRAVMEILGRRSKNNPVLVGNAGVGKTAIVEGLAMAIESGSVPDILKGKTVYSMELGALIAGTKYRGEFEERIQSLLKFAKEGAGEFIIFIDEIHQIIGAGKTDGAMDAANLLKPALSRGELHCIGATTFDEYQKYILKDPALERRFRSVPVHEPSKEDSIEILMGIKDKFEAHHGIKISDEAIYNAVLLSDQYITDKNLPDKAIDLIDESASALKLSAEAMPANLEILQSEIRNKKILNQVNSSKGLENEIKELQKEFDEGFSNWEVEVSNLKKLSEIKGKLDRYNFDLEKAQREGNYELASELQYSLIPEAKKELESLSNDWVLNKKNIAEVISRQTKIPVEKILKTKQDNLLKLNEIIKKRVFGQDKAVDEISDILLTSYAGLSDETRPMGSFMLLGPTGVGKTETAKAIAQELFDSEDNLLRFDLSEFSEKHSVAKLIGAPAGYVGYDDGGVLTEAVRRHPYSVILFDEVEKAHPDFSDILLQILDDGRLTDNKGRAINFKNTIIFLTSNSKNKELDFKPEVLGRLDGVLEYNSLKADVMESLVNKQIRLLTQRVKDKFELSFTEDAINIIATLGFDERYGARPLASTFNRLVIRPMSKIILSDQSFSKVEVKVEKDSIKVEGIL